MKKSEKVNRIIEILKREYPEPLCMLCYKAPHEMLIAVRLSAQCTDKRVNISAPILFDRYKSVEDFVFADVKDIEEIIKPCGLHKTKAADIVGICGMLREKYGGAVPEDMEQLLELPGVGRKTANLIRGELFGKPAIVADTHVIRLSNRLGLAKGGDAFKVEKDLLRVVPKAESLAFCHRLVNHGRKVCKARRPDCGECGVRGLCANPPDGS